MLGLNDGLTDGEREADGLTLGLRLGDNEGERLGDTDGLAETPAAAGIPMVFDDGYNTDACAAIVGALNAVRSRPPTLS